MADPTGVSLPALTYNGKTRVGGEFYLYVNYEDAYYLAEIGVDADSNEQVVADAGCGSAGSLPVSGFGVIRAKTPIGTGSSDETTWDVGSGEDGVLPAQAPPDQAAEVGSISSVPAASGVTVTNGTPGDSADLIVLPNPANDILICYDQGLSSETPDENRAIPRKFNSVDHYVRQRVEKTLSVSDLKVCNIEGLAKLKNRDVCLIGKYFPDGGAVPSEIIYYTRVRLSVPEEIPEDANESVLSNATGSFRDRIVFSAKPT